ncbi:putative G-protein coupled receptor 83-like protein [Leptotrombidium deliense]|uniref:Putative G-protein coupled receptor 83-like protein n=1 Tax=Leptotrombidium deliense TaxID=299467 RepID=A0A443S7Z3_9ACAR|nr:putative G-protein coupled receptor 83-like protein [Leptotrombidium deliense]
MNSSHRSDHQLEVDPEYNPIRDVSLLTLYSITALFAIVSNCCVCKIVLKNDEMQTKTNLLIVSMAVSDIIAGIGIVAQWLFCSHQLLLYDTGRVVCGFLKSLQIITYSVSSLTMITIALHRYLSIFHHSRLGIIRMKFNVKAAIISTWIIAIVFVAMTAMSIKIFKFFTPKEIITCEVILQFSRPFDSKSVRKIRVGLLILAQFLLPLLITASLYARIMFVVFRRQVVGESNQHRSRKLSESKKKTILMLVVVLVVFTICWLPVHIHHLLDFFFKPKSKQFGYCNNSTSYFILYWLGISSCCYNPIIYYIFNPRFRNEFKRIFRSDQHSVTAELKISNSVTNTRESEYGKPADTVNNTTTNT